MRVLLTTISPSITEPSSAPISLSIINLKLAALQAGFADVELLEFPLGLSDESILRSLDGRIPDLVGFSCYVWNLTQTLRIAKGLKARSPSLQLLLGGPEAGPIADEILKDSEWIDFIIRQEGEISFVRLLETLGRGTPLDEVKGLSYRKQELVIHNEDQSPQRDFTGALSPYLDSGLDFSRHGYLILETSRGCPMRCRFCQWNDTPLRYLPLPRVLQEIDYLNKLEQLGHLYIADSSIFYNKRRAKAILEAFAKTKRRYSVYIETDINALDQDAIALMASVEGVNYAFGLQSINPEVNRLIGRRLDLDKIRWNIDLFRKCKTKSTFTIDLVYGLPGDTLEGYKRSLDFAMSLFPDGFTLYPFILLVGSEFYQMRESLNLKFEPFPPRWVTSSESFPRQDRETARALSYFIQMMYSFPLIAKLVDVVWERLNQNGTVGHVEIYERLKRRVDAEMDLSAAWGEIGAGGYEPFWQAPNSHEKKMTLMRIISRFVREELTAGVSR